MPEVLYYLPPYGDIKMLIFFITAKKLKMCHANRMYFFLKYISIFSISFNNAYISGNTHQAVYVTAMLNFGLPFFTLISTVVA